MEKKDDRIKEKFDFGTCQLFKNLSSNEIKESIQCSHAKIKCYKKGDYLFSEGSIPEFLFLLISGEVLIGRHTASGEEQIINGFRKEGTLFGEVFVFLEDHPYDFFCRCREASTVLRIPKGFFIDTCEKNCPFHKKIIENMLHVLAEKAYFLTQKQTILSALTLRQKIIRYLLQRKSEKGKVIITMSRDELAAFLGTTRPSLSRELMKMKKEGLILIQKNMVQIQDLIQLEQLY